MSNLVAACLLRRLIDTGIDLKSEEIEALELSIEALAERDGKIETERAKALRYALDYIDSIPKNVAAAFPAMPGFDRDWAENLTQRKE